VAVRRVGDRHGTGQRDGWAEQWLYVVSGTGTARANEHGWAEQWLYVVSGTGTARVGGKTVRLRAGSLLLIEKREPHSIRAGKRARLVTLNVYVPPAYSSDGEPLR
jgi:mannose-6-phosphate isomerase-like protein (cupin superfamily)